MGGGDIRKPVVLATLDEIIVQVNGEWVVEMLTMSQLSTLFAFLDFQAGCLSAVADKEASEDNRTIVIHTKRNLAITLEQESNTFMGMLISVMLNPQDARLEILFSFVRNLETYWIANFLLSQVMNQEKECCTQKIYHASKIYGVSESYFRKLCHHAFTRGPKKQLRIWRAAHSALQLIEKDNSIATIAGDNGYASSSHLSSEIKSFFGITPREFKKLEGLLHE